MFPTRAFQASALLNCLALSAFHICLVLSAFSDRREWQKRLTNHLCRLPRPHPTSHREQVIFR